MAIITNMRGEVMFFRSRRCGFCFLVAVFSIWASGIACGQTYTDLYNFAGSSAGDGADPEGSLTAVGPILYGMTTGGGGANDQGTIFSFNTLTGAETVLHTFAGGPDDGGVPMGSLLQSGSIFYGLTSTGGTGQAGSLFVFNPANNIETPLYSFGSTPQDVSPFGSLIQSGTTLYGTTSGVLTDEGGGIFSFDTATNTETPLYPFVSPSGGYRPIASLVQSGSMLYGMTLFGGSDNAGAIFSYNLSTGDESVLHSFNEFPAPTNGSYPYGSLTLSGSTLYGMTALGGNNGKGSIFSYDTSGGIFKLLFSFDTTDGDGPQGDLLADGSILYGMTLSGGGNGAGDGTIFAFNTTNDTETILHTFDGADGSGPLGGMTLVGSTLYGMTTGGGTNNDGVIFSITVPEPTTLSLLAMAGGFLFARRRTKGLLEFDDAPLGSTGADGRVTNPAYQAELLVATGTFSSGSTAAWATREQ